MAQRYLWRTRVVSAALLVLSAGTALGGAIRLTRCPGFQNDALPSGVDTAPRQEILRVGVFTADGAGNLKGRTIATTDDGLVTLKIDFNWTGTRWIWARS